MVQVSCMSFTLRALLVFFAVAVFYFVIRKLKKAQMQVLDSLFWILFFYYNADASALQGMNKIRFLRKHYGQFTFHTGGTI